MLDYNEGWLVVWLSYELGCLIRNKIITLHQSVCWSCGTLKLKEYFFDFM